MRLLLDTNTLSYLIKKHQSVLERFEAAVGSGALFLLGSVAHYELTRYLYLKGARRLLRDYEDITASWPRCNLHLEEWEEAARVWADRHRLGRSIADLDLFLAVLARREDAVLVSSNVKHFEGLGISIEDWTLPA
jgi:predicted nucleic acid-binding protein